jgi:hypothetical protein
MATIPIGRPGTATGARQPVTAASLLGRKVARSELTYVLVMLDKQYVREAPTDRWADYYSRALIDHFAPRG